MNQLKIALKDPPILTGKKDERISISVSTEFKELIDYMVKKQGTDISKLGHRYFVEGICRDIGDMFMAEPYLGTTLAEILKKESG